MALRTISVEIDGSCGACGPKVCEKDVKCPCCCKMILIPSDPTILTAGNAFILGAVVEGPLKCGTCCKYLVQFDDSVLVNYSSPLVSCDFKAKICKSDITDYVDLVASLREDIYVQSTNYNSTTKIATITLTNGTNFTLDLSDLEEAIVNITIVDERTNCANEAPGYLKFISGGQFELTSSLARPAWDGEF